MSSKAKHQHQKKSTVDQSRGQLSDVTEVWLICAPGDQTPKATWEAVNTATSNLSTNYKFHIPDMKAGICICITSNSLLLARYDYYKFFMHFLLLDIFSLFCMWDCV